MPSLSGILRIGVAVLGLLACGFLLGGLLSYKRISAKDMQLEEVVQIHGGGSDTIVPDYGAGAGKLAFERGFHSSTSGFSSFADKYEVFQVTKNNPKLKKCWGYYKDEAKLIPGETTGCKTQYISSVGVCDQTTPKGSWVYPGEYQEDLFIEDINANKRENEKAGRQKGGEDGAYIASAFGALLIGISVAWWSNDQERKSVHVAALMTLIIFIALPYIWFGSARDNELIDFIECKDMTDLEYYGSEPAAKCYTSDRSKYGWSVSSTYLDREKVEMLDATCSSFKQSECALATDCTWQAAESPAEDSTDMHHGRSKLEGPKCRSSWKTGYNAWECSEVQEMYWKANGLQWQGATRKSLNKAVRDADANADAKRKASRNNFKLSADHCLKLKESKCVLKIEDSINGCTDSEKNKLMCGHSTGLSTTAPSDIVYGLNVPVYQKVSGSTNYDPTNVIKDWLGKYQACSADEVAYVELLDGYKKSQNNDIPTNCLSDQEGEGRSKFMDEVLLRIAMAQTGIILMMVEGGLIFILLVLEVLAGKKDQGSKMDQVTPV